VVALDEVADELLVVVLLAIAVGLAGLESDGVAFALEVELGLVALTRGFGRTRGEWPVPWCDVGDQTPPLVLAQQRVDERNPL